MATGSSVLPFARRWDPRIEVRPARPGEPVARTLDEAGFGPHVARLLGYPRDSPHGEILVAATNRGRLVGGACMASFGATGWIGALGVLPRVRRRGIGELLTRTAIEWLEERGARTSLLYATEMGRRVYERVGFVAEAPARAWRGTPPGPVPSRVRRLRPGDREAILALDRAATAEDRSPVLDRLPALLGLGLERDDGTLAAYALNTPWGAGPAVVADDEESGLTMLRALVLEPQPVTVTVPADNPGVGSVLARWGFQPVNTALRMRYGPPVGHDPTRMFGLFNLFFG
ncbi:MAG TPA: GNAT family N-acetyltransferase [Solirubrobacteraceae bacterium]|nr:GNAT family N-acetyltransferase [Solirubrobacteraceae bacterium]